MTYEITLRIKNPSQDILAVKEAIAYDCEKYGDLEIVRISQQEEHQTSLWGTIPHTKEERP